MLIFIFLGISAGFIAASINSFKDSPYENFVWLKFFRSFFLGAFIGFIYYLLHRYRIVTFENLGILLLSIIPAERGLGELYKGFLKQKNHPEYIYVLKKLHVPLGIYPIKLLLAMVILIFFSIIITSIVLIADVIVSSTTPPLILKGIIIGFFSTFIVATGGGIKDAQFEGFNIKKFFRSPIVGMFTGVFLIHFTQEPILLVLSNIGLERIVVECYKTFITRRVRGIHEGKRPKYQQWFSRRWIFFFTYCLNVLFMFVLLF